MTREIRLTVPAGSPAWLAQIVPSINDETSEAYWPSIEATYADVSARWTVLDVAAWDRVQTAFLKYGLGVVKPYDERGVVEPVLALLDQDGVTDEQWGTAADAAFQVVRSSSGPQIGAANAASTACRGSDLQEKVVASWAAWTLGAAAIANGGSADEAKQGCWDGVALALLGQIAAECNKAASA